MRCSASRTSSGRGRRETWRTTGAQRRPACGRSSSTRRAPWRSPASRRSRSHGTVSRRRSSSRAGLERWRRRSRGRSARSAMPLSSSAAIARGSRPSTSWGRSSRACPRTPASRTRASCSATMTAPSPRCGWLPRPPCQARRRRPGPPCNSESSSSWEATTRARSGSTASRSPTSPDTQPLSTASHSSRPLGSGCPGLSPSSAALWRPRGCPSTSPRSATC